MLFALKAFGAMSRSKKREPSPAPLVIIASPSQELRDRFKEVLGNSFPVQEVDRQADLGNSMAALSPNILLLDLTLSRPEGVVAVPAVQRQSPSTKIVLLTDHLTDAEGINALKAGAKGYCHKDIAPRLLRKALISVQKGEIWVGRTLVPRLLEELTSLTEHHHRASGAESASRLEHLTQRELEVARLIGGGASNKEIATRLNISGRTVKAHVTAIFRRLGISDRLRLALFVVNSNLNPIQDVSPTPELHQARTPSDARGPRMSPRTKV